MSGFIFKHRRGITGTLILHIGLAILLIFSGLTTPLPLPEEEGILINFGTSSEGEGLIEPSGVQQTPVDKQPESALSVPESQTGEAEEEILTQDFEEAPPVESDKQKDSDETKDTEALEKEQKKEEELERQRIIEEQKRIQAIKDRTRNALDNSRNRTDNNATSEGETAGQGNQGSETGSVNSDNHSPGPGGLGDEGISYSLAGRTPKSLPKPEYNYQEEGKVVVEVTVDPDGNVTKATAGVKGSTTLDDYLLRAARKAALAAKFDKKPNAPEFQKGTITYYFQLQ